MIKKLKLILIIIFCLYQNSAISKTTDKNDFNPKYLSNYLSALILKNNQNSDDSIKYFNLSKNLISKHQEYFKNYVNTLVVNGEVKKSINIIKKNINNDNTKFFETSLLLLIDGFKKKEFKENIELLYELEKYRDYSNYHFIVYEVLKSYNELFLTKKINLNNDNFGKLSLINEALQHCYLNEPDTSSKFINLINSDEGDYTRYLFFYINNLIKKKDFEKVISVSSSINELSSSLLIQQAKQWINEEKFYKFDQLFSCENEEYILSEFFFLI